MFLNNPSYLGQPLIKTQFSHIKLRNGTQLYVQRWAETQMAFGQVRKLPLKNNEMLQQMQAALNNLKGSRLAELLC